MHLVLSAVGWGERKSREVGAEALEKERPQRVEKKKNKRKKNTGAMKENNKTRGCDSTRENQKMKMKIRMKRRREAEKSVVMETNHVEKQMKIDKESASGRAT